MNLSRFGIIIVFTAFISACVGMDSATEPLVGQNISVVVNKLGFPTEKREMFGHTIYTWKTGQPTQYFCDLDLAVDENGIITKRSWNGNNDGCETLAGRLE